MHLRNSLGGGSELSLLATTLEYHNCERFRKLAMSCPYALAGLEEVEEEEPEIPESAIPVEVGVPAIPVKEQVSAAVEVIQEPQKVKAAVSNLNGSVVGYGPLQAPLPNPVMARRTNQATSGVSKEVEAWMQLGVQDPWGKMPTKLCSTFEALRVSLPALKSNQSSALQSAAASYSKTLEKAVASPMLKGVFESISAGRSNMQSSLEGIGEQLYALALRQVIDTSASTSKTVFGEFSEMPEFERAGVEELSAIGIDYNMVAITAGSVAILSRVLTSAAKTFAAPRLKPSSFGPTLQTYKGGGGGFVFNAGQELQERLSGKVK